MSEAIGYFDLDGLRLREEPARDARFKVVRRDVEMHEYADGEVARREVIHRHMSNEITSIDIAAACIVEFPDAPWTIRMELARQCWDEARHVAALARRLEEMGGHPGEFPISAFEWTVTSALDTLEARLATQNRTFEAGAMDVVAGLEKVFADVGDQDSVSMLDCILADEVHHVRFANRYIQDRARQDPRVLMKVVSAVRFLSQANAVLQPKPGETNAVGTVMEDPTARVPAVNIEDRRAAEFSDGEIQEILKQAGFRSIVPIKTAEAS